MIDLEKKWDELLEELEALFDQEMTLKGVLYLIGVQELSLGIKQYERDEKANVLHVGICKILTPFGFYKFDRLDEDGWPHYIELKAIKNLSESQQELLMKEAVLKYLS